MHKPGNQPTDVPPAPPQPACGGSTPSSTPRDTGHVKRVIGVGLAGFLLATPGWAAVTLTLGNGVVNPPANVNSGGALNPEQTAQAYTASVVTEASVDAALKWTLGQQGFTAANNWSVDTATVSLKNNDYYKLTQYSLQYNGGANNGFQQKVNFTLMNNAGAGTADLYNGVPNGATVHWVQLLVESYRVNNFGYNTTANGTAPPVFKLDNGSRRGAAASGPGSGPYYDSNADPGFSIPPGFYDGPGNYKGGGFYFQAFTFPTWDVFTPAGGGNPATETLDVGDYGVSWGFGITAGGGNPAALGNVPLPVAPVPEASTTIGAAMMLALTLAGLLRQRLAGASRSTVLRP